MLHKVEKRSSFNEDNKVIRGKMLESLSIPDDDAESTIEDNNPDSTVFSKTNNETPINYETQSELYIKQNQRTLELINKALEHIRVYDSRDTALQLVGKAYKYCPSIRNKFNISTAAKSLRAAIKAEKWSKSKRKFRHIREGTISNNMETFFDNIAEAALAIQIDIEKNNKTFFKSIQKNYHSELPVTLPDTKSYKLYTAPTIVMVNGSIDKQRKIQHLEHSLFLIEDANLIGVNSDKCKKPLEKANAIAKKRGITIYEQAIARPSSNIVWFLIQDFGCKIKFASFPEFLDVPDETDLSYDGLSRKSQQMEEHERRLKNTKLRSIREQFYSDNATIIQDIKTLTLEYENFLSDRKKLNEEFIAITTFDDQLGGLDMKFRNRLHSWSLQYRSALLSDGVPFELANKYALEQRVEANTVFYDGEEIKVKQKEVLERLKFLKHMLESNKTMFAEKMGLVSTTKVLLI